MHLQDQHSAPGHIADLADSVAGQMQLGQALERLGERDREVLRLIGWEELDISEAALVMGCTRAATAVRLHRARRRLALVLQATEQPSAATVVAET
jgi:RNA polymerase sigma-70 factor, ECF subfamily